MLFFLLLLLRFSGDISQVNASDGLDKLRRSIPGEPDVDYPIFKTPPDTEFSCKSRAIGINY